MRLTLKKCQNLLSDRTVIELRPGSFYTNFYSDIKTIKEHGALMAGYGGEDDIAEVVFDRNIIFL